MLFIRYDFESDYNVTKTKKIALKNTITSRRIIFAYVKTIEPDISIQIFNFRKFKQFATFFDWICRHTFSRRLITTSSTTTSTTTTTTNSLDPTANILNISHVIRKYL